MRAPGTVLVTGASGRIGRRLLPMLRERGWRVRCLVHRRPVEDADERFVGDLADEASLERALTGTDAVLHLAAVTHGRSPTRYSEANVAGTRNLVDAAARVGIGRFVYASTRAVSLFGGPYSATKFRAEELVRTSGLDYTIVRLPELYGTGGDDGLDRIVSLARRGAPIPIAGRGTEELRPVFVPDAVGALANALERDSASGKTYTLGGDPMTVRDFVALCVREFGSRSRTLPVPIPAVRALSMLARFAPLPLYPDQLARLRAGKPAVSREAVLELDFHPRSVPEGLRALGAETRALARPSQPIESP